MPDHATPNGRAHPDDPIDPKWLSRLYWMLYPPTPEERAEKTKFRVDFLESINSMSKTDFANYQKLKKQQERELESERRWFREDMRFEMSCMERLGYAAVRFISCYVWLVGWYLHLLLLNSYLTLFRLMIQYYSTFAGFVFGCWVSSQRVDLSQTHSISSCF
jgi:hypothetical protein